MQIETYFWHFSACISTWFLNVNNIFLGIIIIDSSLQTPGEHSLLLTITGAEIVEATRSLQYAVHVGDVSYRIGMHIYLLKR